MQAFEVSNFRRGVKKLRLFIQMKQFKFEIKNKQSFYNLTVMATLKFPQLKKYGAY